MSRPNPWVGVNYIPDNTRMDVPPAYFLQRLSDFDADLVVVPSRMVPFAYVIARRRRLSAGLTDKAIEDTITVSDTKMCLLYGLVPVCLMYRQGFSWDPDPLIRTLKARDMWAHGGAEKVADMLEAQEDAEAAALKKSIRDDLWHRSGDAWRSYTLRTGQATGYGGTLAQSGRRVHQQSPSESTAGSGSAQFRGE